MEQNNIYVFEPYRLETATQLLWKEETQIAIAPKVYRLLLCFLRHPGHLLSREALFDKVWDGRLVDDAALRLAVNALRKALQDSSKAPRFIETVCKRGYRFLADVTVMARQQIAEEMVIRPLPYRPQMQEYPAWFGCTQQLAQLQETFQQVSNGERRMVFLQGEQGMGKTALLDAFLNKIHHPELSVLRARCVQLGSASEPFLPLLEALERRCREVYGKLLIERLHQLAPSWLYQMLNVLDSSEVDRLLSKVNHTNTGRMLREGAGLFETLNDQGPFVLVLDNAHWCDEFTLNLLNFLMFRCSPAKLLIIVSYRPDEDGPGTQRIATIQAELSRRGLCQELSMHSQAGLNAVGITRSNFKKHRLAMNILTAGLES